VAENGRSTLSLIDGTVELTAAQQTETLQSGEQGVVDPGQPPRKSALLNAINVIQWVLYYPAVVDVDEIGLSAQEQETFSESLEGLSQRRLAGGSGPLPGESRSPRIRRGARVARLAPVGRRAGGSGEADLRRCPP
jgi:hypothetical protein